MSKKKQRRQAAKRAAKQREEDNSSSSDDHNDDEPDYGMAVDAMVQSDDDEEEEEEIEQVDEKDESTDEDDAQNSDSDDDDDDDENEEVDVAAALFQGSNPPADEDDDDDDDSSDDEEDISNKQTQNMTMTQPSTSEPYTFDLRNMLAISTDQLATSSLYSNSKNSSQNIISIPLEHPSLAVNEDYLLQAATSGCTQLIRALWQLPTEQSDAGPLVTLPSYDEIRLPRALAPPPPKQETKWEKFAKAKGIPLNKEKRSRKVFDETTQTWMYRHGYEKANKKDKEWPIMEVGANDDPFEDPWEKLREAKKARVDKNIASRMKNEEKAGNLAKGATNRVMKGKENAYKAGKEGGRTDVVLPVGVPVDLKDGNSAANASKLRGKTSTVAALTAVQRSTASLGKFDKMREGEPERKKTLTKMKKRKYESATDKKVISTEGEKSMKILKAVISGGGATKEKAIRKGQLARGETAYDYDYDDGLGASTFRKKKGRAGAGKMKKMTKKRVK
ncbi:ribosome biogenesis regulatory protein RRS1 [Nitzschia inconspicua]|uniref:Ribosome biogenesis regulatory protein RRS1 n=1 Tax=Nitzschia inconspicua TaxID=303405 RepID=A0A9K3LEF6_9STRA|nr:ribosome biogenesis regulatory protein RRS1 [Nitzschia inconspicua]